MSEPVTDTGTPAEPAAAVTSPMEPAAPAAHWSGLTDPSDIGYAENKGWQNASDVIAEYRDYEKFKGVDKEHLLQLPSSDNPDGMGEVWNKLGRPAEASGYVFEPPEGSDINTDLVESFREFAHKKGLTGSQFTDVSGWQVEQATAAQTAQAEADQIKFDADVVELKNACGTKYDEVVDMADRAAAALGLEDQVFTEMCKVSGPKVITEMFSKMAKLMSEDTLSQGSGRTGYGQTLEQLISEKDMLLAATTGDPTRNAAYMECKGADKLKLDQLYAQIAIQEGLTQTQP